jgi:F0F1-type ATP synthase delta subunit
MKQAYITAIVDSLLTTKDVEVVLKNATALLSKKGHTRLWPAVLRGVVRELEKRTAEATPHVAVAKESVLQSEALKQALASLGAIGVPKTVVDSSLIGGFLVQYQDRLIDASYKRALTDLYRKVTK